MNLFNLVAKLSLNDKDYKKKVEQAGQDTQTLADKMNTAKTNINKMQQEVKKASATWGKNSAQVLAAKKALQTYTLGLDDATFKQVYLKNKLGLTESKLMDQANSIKINARMIKMMGNATDVLTQKMEGLKGAGVKPEDLMPKSTVGHFEAVNTAMGATNLISSKLSVGYRTLGASVEKVIKNYSVQKVAIREAQGDMVKYGLILRNLTRMQGNLALAIPMVGIAATLWYGKLFKMAKESDGALQELADTTKNKVVTAMQPLIKVTGDFLNVAYKIIGTVSDWITRFNEAHPAIARVLAVIGFLAPAMTLLLAPMALGVGLFKGWMIMLNMVWTALGGVIAALGIASSTFLTIAAVVGSVVLVFKHFMDTNEEFRNKVISAWNTVKTKAIEIFGAITNTIKTTMGEWVKAFNEGGLGGLATAIGNTFSNLGNYIIESIPKLIASIDTVLVSLVTFWAENAPKMWAMGLDLLMGIIQGITNALPQIIESLNTVITTVISVILENLPKLIDSGVKMLISLLDGIMSQLPALLDGFIQIITSVLELILDNLPKLIKAGIDILMALIDGLLNALPQLIDAVMPMIPKVIQIFMDNLPKLIDAGIKILTAVIQGIIKTLPQLLDQAIQLIPKVVKSILTNLPKILRAGKDMLISLIDGFISSIPQLLSSMADIGKNVVEGIWNGIKSMGTWLKDKFSGFLNGVVDNVKNFLGIHSPSRLFRDEIGKMIPQGMAIGIKTDFDEVNSIMDKELNSLVNVSKDNIPQGFSSGENVNITFNNSYNKPINEGLSARLNRIEMQKAMLGVI